MWSAIPSNFVVGTIYYINKAPTKKMTKAKKFTLHQKIHITSPTYRA